ncbi:hypothetical protein [Leifsonia sp. Leaf264]|uniref:hypothetical protein n=1 Tax=Leifsonia sp. Leaf264 TaxID=1736314 RepID=UPI0006F32297|nr:hypothetical protein [Leifsonia sp. Leaf264]KQO99434.1 hypothetical protein ASF30_05705 [Leifsonia sp. Leaf264]
MRSRLWWPVAAVATAILGAMIPLVFDPRFYFVDDTQSGAMGQWYEIGARFLAGDWSLIAPTVWQSGNYLAEGAWGIFSPPLWLIGAGMHLATDAVVYMTAVKLVFIGIAAFGVWLLARTFGAKESWAAVAAVAVPLTGFTLYIDAASWVNGFMAWAIWPLAWALTRRAVFQAKSPILPLLAFMGLIGIGYVHATLMLAAVLAATIVEAFLQKHRPTIVRAFAAATLAGLFAVIVHLPGLLVAPVTGRASGIGNSGLLTVSLNGLAASSTPVGSPWMKFFSGLDAPGAPILYIAWFLPLLAFVDWRTLVAVLRSRVSIVIVLAIALLAVLLPSDFGPLRFPVRLMPYLSASILVILAIALSLAPALRLGRARLGAAAAVTVGSAYFAFSAAPQYWKWIAVVTVVSIAMLYVVYRLLGGGRRSENPARRNAPALVAVVVIGTTVALLVPQHHITGSSPLPDYGNPSLIADYKTQYTDAVGDVIVVGGVRNGDEHPEYWAETLMANMFYINDASVQNAYSAVYYPAYQSGLCMQYNGSTCGELFEKLFEVQPQTGKTLVDLIGVSTIQLVKAIVPEETRDEIPDGWHVAEDTELTRLLVRDEPVAPAGGVVWSSDGTTVTQLSEDAMGASFRVDSVGSDGGTVALSRIPWPGYEVEGATLTKDPVEPFLLGVHVEPGSEGTVVHVSYHAPGYPVELAAGALIVLIGAAWAVLRRLRRRDAANGPFDRLVAGTRATAD